MSADIPGTAGVPPASCGSAERAGETTVRKAGGTAAVRAPYPSAACGGGVGKGSDKVRAGAACPGGVK
jgi:hypothetical protein